jgi:hypothetical protein
MGIRRESRAEHAAEDEVRFERSIDARSARIELGFCVAAVGQML